jgi:hypothetical protein
MKRLYRLLPAALLPLLVWLAPAPSTAQYLPTYVTRALDTALGAILMKRDDLFLRWDAVPDDAHRLRSIKRLFDDPLSSFSLADTLGKIGRAGAIDPQIFFRNFAALLDLGDGLIDPSRPLLSDAEIKLLTKIDLNTLNYRPALILRRYLALSLTTYSRLLNARSGIDSATLGRIVSYSDSLVLQSEEAAEASLVEMRMGERYGLERSKQFFEVDATQLNHGRLLSPGVSLYMNALELARTMAAEAERSGDSIKTQIWETWLGKVVIGGPGSDTYAGDFFCIIDVGGDDIYRAASRDRDDAFDRPVSLIVDFAGNDTYLGEDYSFGGTLFGASTLIDLGGDDRYAVQNFSLGCGYFGVGVLYDAAGSDVYTGGTCVEGAGLFGIGLLVDDKGNDTYRAHLESQGFGYTRGIGGIAEGEGNDTYIAASPYIDFLRYDDHFETFCQGASLGARPVASGGIGFIAEQSGSDSYQADIFGQGTAYWYGFGTIVDRRGNDQYTAFQYAQGSGVHLASAVLIDDSGNDNYVSHGVSQGCGHDIAFGGLYDALGDDNYVVESLSLGGGNADAISLFVDAAGADGYIARHENTLGYSDVRRMYGMIGIFLELDGKDFYGTSRGGNDTLWTGSFYGVGLDGNFRPSATASGATPVGTTGEPDPTADLATDIPTLFIQASAAPQKYQYLVEPARKQLVDRADESIPFLMNQLGTESARERLALGIILPRIGKRVVQQLIDTVLLSRDFQRVTMAIYSLGEMHDSTAAVALGRKLTDGKNWLVRASAGEAILKMDASSARSYLRQALRDSFELVRGRAARALAIVANREDLGHLAPLINDRSQIVRYQLQMGLKQRGADSIAPFLIDQLQKSGGYASTLLAPLANDLKDSARRIELQSALLKNRQPKIRATGVRLATIWNDPAAIRRAAAIRSGEKSSIVLYELDHLPVLDEAGEATPGRKGRQRNR